MQGDTGPMGPQGMIGDKGCIGDMVSVKGLGILACLLAM